MGSEQGNQTEEPVMTSQTFPYAERSSSVGNSSGRVRPGFWRAPFAAATYREVGFVLGSLPIAILGFTFAVTFFSLGVGLLVTALGFPVFALFTSGSRGFAALERHRAATLLGTEVAAPAPVAQSRPGFWGSVTARMADKAGWKAALYQVLMLPWSILSFTLTVTFLVTGWVLALYPAYHWVFARYTDWPGYRVYDFTTDAGAHHEYYLTSAGDLAGVSLLGLVLVFLTPALIRGLTNLSRAAVKGLCGSR
ncbi:sensor domain-containing protein [Kitasatospora sp. NBC_00070]|uniref:sensor domain-containing protein n=1 Tax=Kitasatospora sp. NBC_00070 TaxID=2975962 RepID=UPI003246A739